MLTRFLRSLGLVGQPSPEPQFTAPAEPRSRYADYSVEFYPENGVYYAKYKDRYLKVGCATGIVEANADWAGFMYAERFYEEAPAWKLIDKHIEQQTKENVKVIRR